MKNNNVDLAFAVQDAVKEQQSVLIEASANNAEKIEKNAKNRLKAIDSFSKMNTASIDLLYSLMSANKVSVDDLLNSSNYKATCNRLRYVIQRLSDSASSDNSTPKAALGVLRAHKSNDNVFTFEHAQARSYTCDSMFRNYLSAFIFVGAIKRLDQNSLTASSSKDSKYAVIDESLLIKLSK